MKILKTSLSTILLMFLLCVGVNASTSYMVDDAKALKSATISTVQQNLDKIKKNTDITVEIDMVKSLSGQTIDNYAKQFASKNISGDKYILYVVATGDRQNKLLVGSGVNNVLTQQDISNIASLPNSDFKNNDFDSGILKVGKAIDDKVTTKAVQTGTAQVTSDGYSTTVKHTPNYFLIFIIILLCIVAIVLILKWYQKKAEKEYNDKKRRMEEQIQKAEDSIRSSNSTFHSTSVGDKKETPVKKVTLNYDAPVSNRTEVHTETVTRTTPTESYHNTTHRASEPFKQVHNTTIINNSSPRNDNSFVEGMLIGELIADRHEEHHHHHEEYREPERHYEEPKHTSSPTYDSGSWDSGSSKSSWDNDSSSSSSSSWDSSPSSYDSSSSYDSGSSWDSSGDSSW